MPLRLIVYGSVSLACAVVLLCDFRDMTGERFEADKAIVLALASEGRMEEAEAKAERMLDAYPRAVQSALLLGWIRDGRGNPEGAIDAYRSAVQRVSDRAQEIEIRLSIADVLRRSGDREGAWKILSGCVAGGNETEKSRHLRAALLIDENRLEDALNELKVFAEEFPVNPHARWMRRRVEQRVASASEAPQRPDGSCDPTASTGVRAP